MFRAVQGTYEHAKEAVVGKPQETEKERYSPGVYEKAKETKDAAGSKVGEYADYAGQKARETKDATKQKAGEYADYASQKAKETTEYAGDKAKEGKDAATGKLGELKDRAMGFFTAKKDEPHAHDKVVSGREEVRVQDAVGRGGDKLVIKMEESRPGAVADALKAADRAIGGHVEEEGVIHVERRRQKM
uniref:Embryonic protein DC-8 n=2 Tax=Cajanus cajan TaxID=3821 RepID=A0A151TV98_CAJCA|nr:Embryonic protein DC-8 [Cajanus cajan]